MTPKGLYDKIAAMNINEIIDKAFDVTADNLADINRERMNDGLRADGTEQPHYSYISQKVYGYPDEPIKLKATGAFQAGIEVKRDGNVIHTSSTDPKTKKLEKKYGEAYGTSIFGTSGDYKKQYLADHLRPALHKGITAATGLKFKK